MAFPILTPQVPNIPLPTDIMARIAQGEATSQFAVPTAQANLQQRLQNIATQQQAAQQQRQLTPLRQALLGAQIKAEEGVPLSNQLKNLLTEAQTRLANARSTQAGLSKLTPAQQAINAYLTAFHENPHSANTALLGLAVKKAVQTSAGTSITTPDGTNVSFGGSAKGGAVLPQFQPTMDAQGKQLPLTADQMALQQIFPTAPPPPIQQLPGTSGSRRVAGSTTVDTTTGAVTSRPTRTVTTLNQNAIESLQKLNNAMPRLIQGYTPFSSLGGRAKILGLKYKVGFGGGTPQEQQEVLNFNAAQDEAKVLATDLMRAVGAPNVLPLEEKFQKIFEPRLGDTPITYPERVKTELMNTVKEFVNPAEAAQIEGILAGRYDPKTRTIALATDINPKVAKTTPTQNLETTSTQDLLKMARGG